MVVARPLRPHCHNERHLVMVMLMTWWISKQRNAIIFDGAQLDGLRLLYIVSAETRQWQEQE